MDKKALFASIILSLMLIAGIIFSVRFSTKRDISTPKHQCTNTSCTICNPEVERL